MTRRLPLLWVLLALPGLAHAPGHLRAGEPFTLEKPAISYALFGEFLTGEELFVVKLTHPTRFGAPLEIFVPHQRGLEAHRPWWARGCQRPPRRSSPRSPLRSLRAWAW